MTSNADRAGVARTPEHSWEAAANIIYPVLRPARTTGRFLAELTSPAAAADDSRPLLDGGPAGLRIAYALRAEGYGVVASGDHLAAWGIAPDTLRAAAFANLARWSATAPWTEEREDGQVLVSSATGDGWDAARILLPQVAAHLAQTLGGAGARVLVGLPAPDLLIAAAQLPGDPDFASLFGEFVAAYAADTDDPIDLRVFELVDGRLAAYEDGL
jgi:uncharacterized protein YtpQ (UPF0354 family)